MGTSAIILAAGSGQRFEGDEPKQFVPLESKPVLLHSVDVLGHLTWIDQLTLVGPQDNLERTRILLQQHEPPVATSVTGGGDTRFASMRSGLETISSTSSETIMVHDAARPGITAKLCERIFDLYQKNAGIDAVIPVIKLEDTIKKVQSDSRAVQSTLDREQLRGAQTPQLFDAEKLRTAVRNWDRDEDPTDDAMLFEEAGFRVETVPGLQQCKKITYPGDLRVVEALLGRSSAD